MLLSTKDDVCRQQQKLTVKNNASSLAKGFAHGPPSLHPWQIELEFVIPADRHLAVFTSPAKKDDITLDHWALLTVSCLTHVAIVYIFDCIHVMFP